MKKIHLHHLYLTLYIVLLSGFSIFVLLDTFVIPHPMAALPVPPSSSGTYTPYVTSPVTLIPTEAPSLSSTPTPTPASAQSNLTPTPASAQPNLTPALTPSSSEVLPALTPTPVSALPTLTPTPVIEPPFSMETISTDTFYSDPNICISITTERAYNTNIHVAEIYIRDISLLKTAFAKDTFGKNIKETTSSIAARHNALLAVNGDYCGFRSNGFVMRNGTIYRDTSYGNTALAILNTGTFLMASENSSSIYDLAAQGALHVFTFGPGLVKNSKILFSGSEESLAKSKCQPRTAIGIIEPLHYLLVVTDGRISGSDGLKFYHLAEFMRKHGCVDAYNLDGGGSSTMWFMGQLVNVPGSGIKTNEREVSDIVYIGY